MTVLLQVVQEAQAVRALPAAPLPTFRLRPQAVPLASVH
jgi:hypothetical protein